MYVCQLSALQLLIWGIHFKESLPEAICCCLQTCNDVVSGNVLPFIVSSADISQLWVYLYYLLIDCVRLFVQTCNVYGAWVTL